MDVKHDANIAPIPKAIIISSVINICIKYTIIYFLDEMQVIVIFAAESMVFCCNLTYLTPGSPL